MDFITTIGNNIKRARIDAGIKQSEMSAALDIPLRTLQRIEQGDCNIKIGMLEVIARYQRKRIDWYRIERGEERRRVRKKVTPERPLPYPSAGTK